ncbi:P-loop NTPase fold protein [Stenotrophomonas sp.]|uniref:KAP family P-loop NTPase fold protein n=1 Tax=Stenotrophomonas sp. TaxID=69392 RepID=UPI0028AAB1A7|nr:P-loop NTPase fold protein [Stenotrophomonas sp.]
MQGLLIFPDDVAVVDLLHAEPLARTIAEVIRAHPDHGLVLGVHGDWGAGKSTVLSLVKNSLEDQAGVAALWFNGWEYEGFEDAKIAILEGIVRHLQQEKKFVAKATDLFHRLRKRIDYLKLARAGVVGGIGALVAGPAGLALMLPTLLSKEAAGENFDTATEIVGKDTPADDPLDLHGFRRDFNELLTKTGIKQLVVLVDDLDRCLPQTAIGTLEAIRLFLSGPRTVFVLGCDRAMIEYAVREHFPARPGLKGDEYARNYLDKLIQVPFVLPVLGPVEVGHYVQLLLLEGVLGSSDTGFLTVLAQAKELLKKPWLTQQLNLAPVQASMNANESLRSLQALMLGIAPVLAAGTDGNPRQIKRFINAVFVRLRAAHARGLDDIKVAPLMKLMLAEYFHPDLFDAIAAECREGDGTSTMLRQLEAPRDSKPRPNAAKASAKADDVEASTDFANDPKISRWATLEPKIAEADLRPYLFIIRDARLVTGSGLPDDVGELLAAVTARKSLLARKSDFIKLSSEGRGLLASEIVTRLAQAGDQGRRDLFAQGLQDLLRLDATGLTGIIDRGFVGMPTSAAGAWISQLSALATPTSNYRAWLQRVTEEGAPRPLASVIQAMLQPRGG